MDLNDPTTVALLAAEAFDAARLPYALYGGLLTAAYGEPRETRDADVAVIDTSATSARDALATRGARTALAFEDVVFGGLLLSRLTLIEAPHSTGLNTIDLVRPRTDRYARLAVDRSVTSTLRERTIRLLTLEDYVLFKALSTRDRDTEDARAAVRRNASVIDTALISDEIARLATELPEVNVRGRWAAILAP